MDRSVICHPRMVETLERLAGEREIHTPTEMADLGDAAACVKLLAAFAQEELTRL